jgi:Na+-driven multidrug efflux pump
MAGLLPDAAVTLSTMGTCLTINAWLYMMPLGLSQAVNTSISNALGAGARGEGVPMLRASRERVRPVCHHLATTPPARATTHRHHRHHNHTGHAASAKRAFIGGLLSGTAMQGLLVLLIITQGRALVGLFTTDPAVITSSCAVLPLLAILVFFDGLNSVVSGVLRGSGRQMLGATVNAFGYFVVGLPLCALLAFKAGWGVEGLWWGVIVGACVQAVVLLSMLLRWEWPREVARVQALLKHAEASGKPMPSFGH